MTDLTAISNKIAALLAEDTVFADGGARVLNHDGSPTPLTAILNEIDNTVLERTLIFELAGVSIAAVVAGRRFRGIVEINGDAPGADAIVGQAISTEDPDTLQAVGALLTGLSEVAGTVTVRHEPVRPIGGSGDAGVSANRLADLWVTDADAGPAPPIERFLSANSSRITGSVYVSDGAVIKSEGESAPLETIWDEQIPEFRARQAKLKSAQDGPMLTCLEGAIGGGAGAALAVFDEEACLFSFESEAIPNIITSWIGITA